MRVEWVQVQDWRGLDVEFRWRPTMVFFGANDVGKSNILESLLTGINGTRPLGPRVDPLNDEYGALPNCFFRLAHTVDTSPDAGTFAALLQYGTWTPPRQPSTPDLAPPLALDDYEFEIAPSAEPRTAAAMRENLREEIELWAASKCHAWDAVAAPYQIALDAALASELFLVNHDGVHWLLPPRSELAETTIAALDELAAARDLFEGSAVPMFEDSVADGDRPLPLFTLIGDTPAGLPIGTSDLSEPSAYTTTLQQLERAVIRRAQISAAEERRAAGNPGGFRFLTYAPNTDPWLEPTGDDAYRVAQRVTEACAALGEVITAAAPPFVRDHVEIYVEALSPMHWRAHDGARLRVALRRLDEEQRYPLPSAGMGVQRWTLLTIELLLAAEAPQGSQPDVSRLLVFDEPERHLHPLAQQDAARWLADRATGGADLAIATHSAAFLAMPSTDAGYYAVRRHKGRTTAHAVDEGMLDFVASQGRDYGLSSADVLLLTRAVLLVEGKHDEQVLHHCYGNVLREHRILVVPIRGTDNAPGVPETEYLSRLNARIIVLFDGTLAVKLDRALAGERVRGMTKEERAAVNLVQGVTARGDTTVDVVPLDINDIIHAFPEPVMREAIETLGGRFAGWDAVERAYRRAHDQNFKAFLLQHSDLPTTSPGHLVDTLLQLVPEHRTLGGDLHRAVQQVVGHLERTAKRPGT